MKKLIVITMIVLTLSMQAGDNTSIEAYNLKYAEAMEKVKDKSSKSLTVISAEVFKALALVESKHKRAGNLEMVLEVSKLIDKYEDDQVMVLSLKESRVPEVQTLIKRMQARCKVVQELEDKEVRRLNSSYRSSLEKRIKALTKEDKIEEAIAFNAALKSVGKPKELDRLKKKEPKPVSKDEDILLGSWRHTWNPNKATHTYYKDGKVTYKTGDFVDNRGRWKKTNKGIEVKFPGYPPFILPLPLNKDKQVMIEGDGRKLIITKEK
jgi:hypothetical protein